MRVYIGCGISTGPARAEAARLADFATGLGIAVSGSGAAKDEQWLLNQDETILEIRKAHAVVVVIDEELGWLEVGIATGVGIEPMFHDLRRGGPNSLEDIRVALQDLAAAPTPN
ncbi:MAG: hypothetical protein KDB94_07090 [Acidobacteria bacterium]|nr:hypothetical protein [Acidobacteriota bacterium]